MSHGFSGKASERYLAAVDDALVCAEVEHRKNPFDGYSGVVTLPAIPVGYNDATPQRPESTDGGGYTIGIGNKSNIVSAQNTYAQISQMIDAIDETSAREIHAILREIEGLCEEAYVLPKALPVYLDKVNGMASSMDEFRSLTHDSKNNMHCFADEMASIY